MSKQQKIEIIKALAYGETPERIAEAEGLTVEDVKSVAAECVEKIEQRRAALKGAGYIG